MYIDFNAAAKFCCLSRERIEQLLRDPSAKFPRPFQPGGFRARRCFKQSELVAWIERSRAKYPQAA
jgi:predicted DNA-binding transcriptional regulator AlpA